MLSLSRTVRLSNSVRDPVRPSWTISLVRVLADALSGASAASTIWMASWRIFKRLVCSSVRLDVPVSGSTCSLRRSRS